MAVAVPQAGGGLAVLVNDPSGALVAGTAEEGVDLGFHRGLDDQAGAESGHVFQYLDQVAVTGEQGINLGTDGLGGRYSSGHERGSA
ncbi:hypothetical protein MOV08_35370 [Streptomyces yunnanensis]|uniref:Uncharacterized protein n=1 Tax=Streptomyces yunnanensis TaxID=156453 RepID=A0ABY8AIM9_9ACTN|nr:hypothetical protein [Streptomyces yunnanensis]WEB44046.1 hypothetical protein MOV08_35370 [Streptomyces yunnanensis]